MREKQRVEEVTANQTPKELGPDDNPLWLDHCLYDDKPHQRAPGTDERPPLCIGPRVWT